MNMDTEKTVQQPNTQTQEASCFIDAVISRFPEAQHPLLRQSLSETETALRNYLFSLVM